MGFTAPEQGGRGAPQQHGRGSVGAQTGKKRLCGRAQFWDSWKWPQMSPGEFQKELSLMTETFSDLCAVQWVLLCDVVLLCTR